MLSRQPRHANTTATEEPRTGPSTGAAAAGPPRRPTAPPATRRAQALADEARFTAPAGQPSQLPKAVPSLPTTGTRLPSEGKNAATVKAEPTGTAQARWYAPVPATRPAPVPSAAVCASAAPRASTVCHKAQASGPPATPHGTAGPPFRKTIDTTVGTGRLRRPGPEIRPALTPSTRLVATVPTDVGQRHPGSARAALPQLMVVERLGLPVPPSAMG